MHDQFYGAIEGVSEQDYLFGGELNLPHAPFTFPQLKIQYNQNQISGMSCTLHGALTAVSNLTNKEYTMVERQDLWRQAKALGASDTVGWYIGKACDLVRQNWNIVNPTNRLFYYRIDLSKHEDVLPLGYMFVTGYKGNSNYNADKNDGVLDEVELSAPPSYYHCITVYKDGEEYVVDNYNGSGHNTYRIKDLNSLIKNGVFYNEAYFFVTEQSMKLNNHQGVSEWAESAVEKCIKKGVATVWTDPQEIVANAVTERMFHNVGLLKSFSGLGVSKERLAVILDRLQLLDDK